MKKRKTLKTRKAKTRAVKRKTVKARTVKTRTAKVAFYRAPVNAISSGFNGLVSFFK